jgi:hypothetical protein
VQKSKLSLEKKLVETEGWGRNIEDIWLVPYKEELPN